MEEPSHRYKPRLTEDDSVPIPEWLKHAYHPAPRPKNKIPGDKLHPIQNQTNSSKPAAKKVPAHAEVKLRRSWLPLVIFIVFFVSALAATSLLLYNRNSKINLYDSSPGAAAVNVQNTSKPAITKSAVSGLGFRVYYPDPEPPGYKFIAQSNKLYGNLYSYKLADGQKTISINQQQSNSQAPSLTNYKTLSKISSPAGNAVAGLVSDTPMVFVVTPTTVITMVGSGGAGVPELIAAAATLQAL
jgi:hypothetical protein